MTMPAEDEDYVHRVGRVGRADKPGIALSIISSQKEKVWYHSNCPDRGRYCKDTRLVERGGCCIWYDEVKIFEKVEKRLGGNPIPILDQQKHLNSSIEIQSFIKDVAAKDPLVAESEKKLKKLLPTIRQLNNLEVTAQNQALFMQYDYDGSGTLEREEVSSLLKKLGAAAELENIDLTMARMTGMETLAEDVAMGMAIPAVTTVEFERWWKRRGTEKSVEGASEVVYGDIHAAHLQAVQEAADAEARAQKVALKDRVLGFVFAMLTKPTGWIRRRRERDYVVPIGDGMVDDVADEKAEP